MKIFLIGFMGSGKTHRGRQLSQKLNLPFFDLDEQIVNSEGKSINEIFAEEGEEIFRLKEKEVLNIITESHASFIMACGGGAPCYFNNIEYMNQSGVTVWLNTPLQVLFKRLQKEREHRPLLRDLSDAQLNNFIVRKFSDRKIYYEQAKVFIEDDEDTSLDQIIEKIFHA
ncbi:shikimate kinase [Terrimonas sp. NA20]|uniref:Shikimate kinase n=1 Tax=Terrimonas ginsenosidimutans TaxID=2908004 RepID=A0ABS9KY67_9BACT|nr:shikimate kinase [Terrimonas ginsenosidimutans]MCG2617286.1 shikimate kinase [Terrimonas ginsenosidimutans]